MLYPAELRGQHCFSTTYTTYVLRVFCFVAILFLRPSSQGAYGAILVITEEIRTAQGHRDVLHVLSMPSRCEEQHPP